MAIKQIELPLYDSRGEDKERTVTIREFAGRLVFTVIEKDGAHAKFECYINDIQRAWQAVKKGF